MHNLSKQELEDLQIMMRGYSLYERYNEDIYRDVVRAYHQLKENYDEITFRNIADAFDWWEEDNDINAYGTNLYEITREYLSLHPTVKFETMDVRCSPLFEKTNGTSIVDGEEFHYEYKEYFIEYNDVFSEHYAAYVRYLGFCNENKDSLFEIKYDGEILDYDNEDLVECIDDLQTTFRKHFLEWHNQVFYLNPRDK